jgi:predicted O-methyltransferase YrrM
MGGILNDAVEHYIRGLIVPGDPLLAEVEAAGRKRSIPIVMADTGMFLQLITFLRRPARVLEVGTGGGYSGLWIARALSQWGGELDTIETDPERAQVAVEYFRRAGLEERVHVHVGPALEILPDLTGPYGMVFLDAVKTEYMAYLNLALPLLEPYGVVAADNALMGGMAADDTIPGHWSPESVSAIRDYNDFVCRHPQLRSMVVPVGDGVTLSVKLP